MSLYVTAARARTVDESVPLSRPLLAPCQPDHPTPRLLLVSVVLACVLAALVQRWALQPWLGDRAPYITVFAMVLFATWLAGTRAGLAVTALGVPACLWLFAGPGNGQGLLGANGWVAGFAAAQCAAIAYLGGALRRARDGGRRARDQAISDFETLADHAPGFVWSTPGEGEAGFVNQAWRSFTGVRAGPKKVDRLAWVHPTDLARLRAVLADARAAGAPYQVEYRLRRADGVYRWILEHGVPRLSADGVFEGFTGSGTDITSSHQERAELRFIGGLQQGLASSLDPQLTAETVTRAVVPELADWCCLQLIDERDGGLRPVEIHHADAGRRAAARAQGRRARADGGLAPGPARLLREGEPHLVARVDEGFLAEYARDEQELDYLRGLGLVSHVAVPLRVAGRTIGLLSFASAESGRIFTRETMDLAAKIGGIAALALENARLHRGVREALAAEERARQEREHSERQFRSAWDADIFAICLIERTGRVRAGNMAFLRLCGHTPEDLEAGRIELRSRLGERVEAFGAFVWENLAEGRRCEPFEKICIRSDGTELPVYVGGSLHADGETAIMFLLDLSARKAAEQELQRQRGLLKTISDAVPAMVAYIDPEERFVVHNRQFENWLGLGADDIRGRALVDLLDPEAVPLLRPRLRTALQGVCDSHEMAIRTGERRRDFMVSYQPDLDASGKVLGVVVHAYDITEARSMAAELASSERRHRTLVTASAAIVWTTDAEGTLQKVDGWPEFTGLPVEPGTCPLWFQLIHPADRDRVKGRWLDSAAGNRAWEETYRMLAADGRYHHVHARAAAVTGADGTIEEWIGTVTDVTKRVEAEQSLRRKEAELQLIVDTMPALVSYVGRDLRYGLANRAYEKWFGVEPEAIRGRPVAEVLGERAFALLGPRFARVMHGEEVAFEEQIEYRHGGVRWINGLYTPHRDESGEILGCFVLVLDITARKHAEQQMAELAERYRFLADAMPQNVWTADAAGRLDYVNQRWCDYVGKEAREIIPDHLTGVIHPDDAEETLSRWRQAVASGERYATEHRLRDHAGNYHWFLSLALARRDQQGRVVQWVGTATNIDAQRRAYLELAEARAELRRHADHLESEVRARTARLSEVNEELEAFTYSASHDLRVPLHHIHGFAQAIIEDRDAGLSPSGHANLRMILNSTERMDKLIRDLLAYSRLSRADILVEAIPFEPILHEVLAQHRATIEAKHAIIHVERPLPPVPADRVGLQQILFNLIGNALKFSAEDRVPEVRIRVEQGAGRARLWVADNGIGIEPHHHDGVFKLFQRLHSARDYSGTGIGLSLVKRAAERMGGICGLESEPGVGSRFWIDFRDPIPTEAPVAGAEVALPVPERGA